MDLFILSFDRTLCPSDEYLGYWCNGIVVGSRGRAGVNGSVRVTQFSMRFGGDLGHLTGDSSNVGVWVTGGLLAVLQSARCHHY